MIKLLFSICTVLVLISCSKPCKRDEATLKESKEYYFSNREVLLSLAKDFENMYLQDSITHFIYVDKYNSKFKLFGQSEAIIKSYPTFIDKLETIKNSKYPYTAFLIKPLHGFFKGNILVAIKFSNKEIDDFYSSCFTYEINNLGFSKSITELQEKYVFSKQLGDVLDSTSLVILK